jgi:DNA repair protein RecO (recombination protein O)
MTHKTKGIVLRTVKYGDTSIVVTILTELFGIQTYIVNGVRSSKKNGAKANYFQPAAILDMVVYHSSNKTMHRIKEFGWAYLYNNVLTNVIKNSIAAYMVELLYKCLKQPETNTELFIFCEDALHQLDTATKKTAANFSLFFALHLPFFLGFKPEQAANTTHTTLYFDLQEGVFTNTQPNHPHFIDGEKAFLTNELLKVMQPYELEHFSLNQQIRRQLLLHYADYYALHVAEFGQLKTLQVLHEVL